MKGPQGSPLLSQAVPPPQDNSASEEVWAVHPEHLVLVAPSCECVPNARTKICLGPWLSLLCAHSSCREDQNIVLTWGHGSQAKLPWTDSSSCHPSPPPWEFNWHLASYPEHWYRWSRGGRSSSTYVCAQDNTRVTISRFRFLSLLSIDLIQYLCSSQDWVKILLYQEFEISVRGSWESKISWYYSIFM